MRQRGRVPTMEIATRERGDLPMALLPTILRPLAREPRPARLTGPKGDHHERRLTMLAAATLRAPPGPRRWVAPAGGIAAPAVRRAW